MLLSDIMSVIVTSQKANLDISEIILMSEIHFQISKMKIFPSSN